MTDIRTTVLTASPRIREYMGRPEVDQALTALEVRERMAVSTLLEVASAQGIDRVAVLNACRQAGLTTPEETQSTGWGSTPGAYPQQGGNVSQFPGQQQQGQQQQGDSPEVRLGRIEQTLESLKEAARRFGVPIQ